MTHTVCFSNSLYIINQKPMIPRTPFHCITTWVACSSGSNSVTHMVILWFRFTSQMALLSNINFYFDCKTRLCLIVPGRQEKIYFCIRKFLFKSILHNINEQDTSFRDCKQKHMMKSGAPPDIVRALHRLLPIEFRGFTSRIDFYGLWLFGPGPNSISYRRYGSL